VNDSISPSRDGVYAQLAFLGWDADFARDFAPHHGRGRVPARVVAEHRGRYVVADDDGERPAALAGRLRHAARGREHLPATGDWVALTAGDGGAAMIHAVLPRRGAFVRDGHRLTPWPRSGARAPCPGAWTGTEVTSPTRRRKADTPRHRPGLASTDRDQVDLCVAHFQAVRPISCL
jgi:hypothetical protein